MLFQGSHVNTNHLKIRSKWGNLRQSKSADREMVRLESHQMGFDLDFVSQIPGKHVKREFVRRL